jgi:AraC-like DNA-binding protein
MGPMGALVLNSATLGAALKNLCDYFPAVQEHSTLALREAGGLVALTYEIRDGRIARRRQDAELSIGIFMSLVRRCLGAGWAPEEVQFEHLRGADAAEVRAVLGAPVYFAAAGNAILFRRGELAARMPGADAGKLPGALARLRERTAAARPDDFVGSVIAEIRRNFAGGEASIDQVARRLAMSRTGLYRRLAADGVDFSTLTQAVRRELAMIYVAQPGVALTEIASLLGYSELSAFTRAFTRWTGCAPARYRAGLLSCC